MGKLEEARDVLKELGMPERQQADLCCYSILAMLGVTPNTPWSSATNEWIRIHDIIQFANINFVQNLYLWS